MYLSTYICTQKLFPTFLRVSKFDIKLGSRGRIFKITLFTCVFLFHTKSKSFQAHRPFFNFDVKLESVGMTFKTG